MKKLLFSIAILASFTACENPVSKKIKETKESVSNTRKAVKEMEKVQEDMEDLKNEEPLTNEELKAWLPDEINGMKRTGYKAGQTAFMQIAQIEATYQNEDKSKKLHIQIMDGAGEMGAAATAGIRILFSQDFEEEDEYKVRRTLVKNGNKAVEEYRKDGSRSEIQYMEDNRFYIMVRGTNMDLKETWDAIDELDTDDLG
ncbi:hypothetical protein C5O00_04030 [Pukyongia salina]|uniref:Uncharacterized protein n=1 Tax=Pukyongia salina TaxID=2094025 RepID=A0A2S0HUZ5_9FLAO|nr:hypothetical protein [Pukyongia salina]AVI50374.1 hypothetical protein C5O00_04030 [Pukyongia salina]